MIFFPRPNLIHTSSQDYHERMLEKNSVTMNLANNSINSADMI